MILLYSHGIENTELIGNWLVSNGPHQNHNLVTNNFVKNKNNIFNKIENIWSTSSLTTAEAIDISKYNKFCIDMDYYIPNQSNTGQGIYWGLTHNSYVDAVIGNYLVIETTQITNYKYCININEVNGNLFPFIEIFNDHTMIPYNGYIINTYIYLYKVWLEI